MRGSTRFIPVAIEKPFSEIQKAGATEKPKQMQAQRALLRERYTL